MRQRRDSAALPQFLVLAAVKQDALHFRSRTTSRRRRAVMLGEPWTPWTHRWMRSRRWVLPTQRPKVARRWQLPRPAGPTWNSGSQRSPRWRLGSRADLLPPAPRLPMWRLLRAPPHRSPAAPSGWRPVAVGRHRRRPQPPHRQPAVMAAEHPKRRRLSRQRGGRQAQPRQRPRQQQQLPLRLRLHLRPRSSVRLRQRQCRRRRGRPPPLGESRLPPQPQVATHLRRALQLLLARLW